LRWQAHGMNYGIPADVVDAIEHGIMVVANVSRTVIADAARRFPVRVIEVTAPADALAARLTSRARENASDVAARLSRSVSVPDHVHTETVMNDASLEEGIARFLVALNRAASAAAG
jgi:ribose 1,5-bisphosphokinase